MCGASVSALMLAPPCLLASAARSLPTQEAACLSISDWQLQYTCRGSSEFAFGGAFGKFGTEALVVFAFFGLRVSLAAAELVALRLKSPTGFLCFLGICLQRNHSSFDAHTSTPHFISIVFGCTSLSV